MTSMRRMAKKAANMSSAQRSTFMDRVNKMLTAAQGRYSSLAVKKRSQLTAFRWEFCLTELFIECGVIEKAIPAANIWRTDILKLYAGFYLPLCVRCTSYPLHRVPLLTPFPDRSVYHDKWIICLCENLVQLV